MVYFYQGSYGSGIVILGEGQGGRAKKISGPLSLAMTLSPTSTLQI